MNAVSSAVKGALGITDPTIWQETLCGCFEDPAICCMGCCCPGILYGQNRDALDGNGCCCPMIACGVLNYFGVSFTLTTGNRTELRKRYGIRGSFFNDCCLHLCCAPCAYCQEAREINRRRTDGRRWTCAGGHRGQDGTGCCLGDEDLPQIVPFPNAVVPGLVNMGVAAAKQMFK
eukprot:TRINITY_DN498_c0_g1_i1.p1 TRINITY_DN498_c0_g1~~TRINITY_DN498_c0_g1_i1.p1  ORF type:complete len:175 (-),score=30.30 TRINITY_DN498_c0_g1_i1:123-647(-)